MVQRHSGRALAVRASKVFVACVLLVASRSFAATTVHTCKSLEVATYAERIHVRCDKAAPGGFVFFALSTTNSAHAARILSTLMTAHVAGRPIALEYDPADTSGTAFGCQANDCRRLRSVRME